MTLASVGGPLLIVGLGNPGRDYRSQRHNVGFMVLDHLAALCGEGFARRQRKALVAEVRLAGRKALLAKPQTFMNLAGASVARLSGYYRIENANLLVVCDDLDLPLGSLRLRPFGGSAGHKGLRSIFDHLGTQDFPRLRVGIGRPPGRMDPAAYVLQPFGRDELAEITGVIDRAVDCIGLFASEGIETAMARFNAPSA